MLTFTVITPSYNREKTLRRVYESLLVQSFTDFEWIIVDDGSTDNTAELARQFISDQKIDIKYIFQKNGHKKTAVNNGILASRGHFIVILDSDDQLLPNSLKYFYEAWIDIPSDSRSYYCGVTGLVEGVGNVKVGSKFPFESFDSTSLDLIYKYHLDGEYLNMIRTDLHKEYLFPCNFEGLCPEGIVWSRIGSKYKTRYINKVVRKYFESEDSISKGDQTNSVLAGYIKNASGMYLYNIEKFDSHFKFILRDPEALIKLSSDHTRLWLHQNESSLKYMYNINSVFKKTIILIFSPVGVALFLRDRWRLKKARNKC
jgi:glycosyltransferase involved in cell wall biosynthesis